MSKKRIAVRSAKNKGMNLQKKICEKIAELFDIEFNNQDDQCEIHSRESGQTGTDIILRGNIYKSFLFDCECKSQEKPSIKRWINQAKSNTKKDRNWLLFWKCKDFRKSVVILDSDVFFDLMKKNLNKNGKTKAEND